LKCGGEKALTKPAPEDTLKCHLAVEEPKELVVENTIVVSNVETSPELKNKKVSQITTGIKPTKKGPRKKVLELYNLEDYAESEKPLKINLDLDLYQMEKV
jgi:hypothetical protein